MKWILFVDDEPRVLSGIRKSMRRKRDSWEMVFAESGAAALAQLERRPFDVIVSDMRMPEMDGAELLTQAQRRFPNVIRIVLSGHAEFEATLRAASVAHRFLVKPCDSEKLEDAIQRALHLRGLLRDPDLAQALASVNDLPSLPSTYAELNRMLADPRIGIPEIARLVEKDMGMCAKIFQFANSAALSGRRAVTSIQQALMFLGTNMLKNLVLSVEVFDAFSTSLETSGFSLERSQRHAVLTAGIAQKLVASRHMAEDTFIAAILHDVGHLVIASQMPKRYAEITAAAAAKDLPRHAVEREILGIGHGQIGAYLLGLWGLPFTVVEAVAHHHDPGSVSHFEFDTLGAVHVANVLAHEVDDGGDTVFDPMNRSYLGRVGKEGAIGEWRDLAETCVTDLDAG